MRQDLQTAATATGIHASGAGVHHGHQSEFRRLLKELDRIFAAFQRLLQEECGHPESEPIRIKLGTFKRELSEHLPELLQRIAPTLSELEFWRPGISSTFFELWLDPPAVIQGPMTWLRYLGQVRGLLLEAVGPAPDRGCSQAESGRRNPVIPESSNPQLPVPAVGGSKEAEPHFTPKQLADLWGLDQSTVRRIFRDEPDVLRIPHLRRRGKRDYVSLRIPASVARRVHERRSRSLFKV